MTTKTLYHICLILLLSSCLVTPPDMGETDSSVVKSNLRTVEFVCLEPSTCLGSAKKELSAVVIYARDECRLFDPSSLVIAMAQKELECEGDSKSCEVVFKSFGDKALVSEGEYSLIAFVDMNGNEFPDIGEPYYCNDSIKISTQKRLVSLAIEIKRLLE